MIIEVPDDLPQETLNYIKALVSEVTKDCGCARCEGKRRKQIAEETNDPSYILTGFMIVCQDCGNKRCPKASWHGYKCTKSNEPNQIAEEL